MLAQRLTLSLRFLQTSWRPLVLAAVVALVALTAVRVTAKALKPGRTGEQSRTAFLRWRPQIQALETGTDIYRTFNYPNPPVMALILKPLMTLPPMTGMLAWFALKVLMAIAMAVMVFRLIESGGPPMPDWAKALAIGLSLHPILGDLSHGNVNLFIAFLIIAGLDCYRRGYDVGAGLLIALAIACKITPALFIAFFVWKRSGRTLAAIATGLALWWVVVPGLLLGFDFNCTLLESWYLGMVKPFLVDGMITSEHPNQSLPGLLTRLFTANASFIAYSEEDDRPIAAATHSILNLGPTAVAGIVKAAMLGFAIVMVVFARTKSRSGIAFAAECSLIVLGMLLFSERTWKHHATTLLLPIAVLVAAAVKTGSRWLWLIAAAVPLLSLVPSGLNEDAQDLAMVYGVYTVLYLILSAGMVIVLLSRNKQWSTELAVTLRLRS